MKYWVIGDVLEYVSHKVIASESAARGDATQHSMFYLIEKKLMISRSAS